MLWDPRRHESIAAEPWDEGRARSAIESIVADAEDRFDARRLWPAHPLDDVGPLPTGLYLGASGTLWALHHLAREGAARPRRDLAADIETVHAAHLAAPDTGKLVPSLLLGESGILLARLRIAPTPAAADRLHALVLANQANPANELLWGAPGTLLAALQLLEWTGEDRWRAAATGSVDRLLSDWLPTRGGPRLWTQHLYGEVLEYLGAAHGFAGNAHALLRAAALLPEALRAELQRSCADTAVRTAAVEDELANWPPVYGAPGRSEWLVQWCHGAPGMVAALAAVPPGVDARFDLLLVQAGELTWRAGPLEKGPGLCHGTAGNGYAFLKLYRRTGDATWLERARAFAMHAIAQSERLRERHGRGRYTLWTGDPGLAVYLWSCIRGEARLPVVDVP